MAVLGQDALGVKLNTFHAHRMGQARVAHTHDFAIGRPCRDRQFLGATRAFNGQGVITVHGELGRQAREYTFARSLNQAGFSVHQLLGPNDLSAKRCAYALVAQAHAQDRQLSHEMLNRSHRNSRFVGRTRAGGNHQAIRLPGVDTLAF